MLQDKISEKQRKLFTGRTEAIRQVKESISKDNIAAVLAPSGCGRSYLLKSLAASSSFYLDLKRISLTPESFSVEFIGTVCFLNLEQSPAKLSEYYSVQKLKELKLGKKCSETIGIVDNELQKIKPDQRLLVESAFRFCEEFASEKNKKMALMLNNFEEILKLNNFSQIRNVLEIFFSSVSQNKKFSFIIASSSVNSMRSLLKDRVEEIIELKPFSLDETKELFEKIAGRTDERVVNELHRLSGGIPLIINSIALRFKEEKKQDTQKNIRLVRDIMVSEICTASSPVYTYCSRLFSDSLNRARGDSLLRTILKVVSQNSNLRLTEIARLIYRSGPVTKSLLERLIEVDLIVKTDRTFEFANPVLKLWCRLMFSSIEFDETPDEKELEELGGLL